MSVSPERFRELEPHLDATLDLETDAERDAYVASLRATDPTLADDLARLLRDGTDERALLGLVEGAPDLVAALHEQRTAAPDLTRRELGPYRILRTIGRGGMSVVYLAERADGTFDQKVAVKVMHWTGGRDAVERFRREQQTLARLDHPSITRILDGGVTEEGLPYFVMEWVDGVPITEHVRRAGLDVRERVRLMVQVGRAVHQAHRNLVVHRDLKPDNILVPEDGRPRVLDFGIAKWLGEEPDQALRTRAGEGMLTPQYGAPEQFLGETTTTASDVYSLGVILYEILAGRLPYELAGQPLTVQKRLVCEEDPPALDGRELRGDLSTIVAKAMHKDPARRYDSAAALADDLERWLGGLPVVAAPDSLPYVASRFVSRHRLPVAITAVAFLSLLGGVIGTTWQAREASRERDRARAEAERAQDVVEFLVNALESANPWVETGEELTVRELVEESVRRVDAELADQPAVQLRLYCTLTRVVGHLEQYDRGEELGRHAVALADSLFGPESAEAGTARLELCRCLSYRDPAEAESTLVAALDDLVDTGSESRLVRASLLEELGERLVARGLVDEAIARHRETLAIRESLIEAPSFELARSHHALATALSSAGNPEAEEHFAEAAEQWKLTVGEQHPNYASTLNNWAVWLVRFGRLDEAEQLYRRAMELSSIRLGDRATTVSRQRVNLAGIAIDRGRFSAAEAELEDTVESLRSENDDYLLAATITNLSHARYFQEDYEAAAAHLLEARGLFAGLYGDPSIYTAICDGYLGRVYAAARQVEPAKARFATAREILVDFQPALANRLVSVDTWEAQLRDRLGESVRALELATGAADRARENLPPFSSARVEAEAELARLRFLAPGAGAAEREELRRCTEAATTLHGESHPITQRYRAALAVTP
ncbi:MAG: serine/threonine protein kinase [Gemmatimonadetes bacterium]|nr:serine/threonine protein kinase [Gemmatimonadota bacterium]